MPRDTSYTLAMLGCGRVGSMHVDTIFNNCPQITIKTVIDNNVDEDWLCKRGVTTISADPLVAFQDEEIDGVLIAASTTAHVSLIQQAANAKKDIFCEKPIALTLDEMEKAMVAVQQAGVRLQVGFNRRFDQNTLKVKNTIQAETIGIPHILKITNRDPKRPDLNYIPRSGGLFLDFNIHDFDTVRFITNDEVKEVFAMGAALVDPQIEQLGDIDTAIITLTLESGAYCVIDTSREALYGYDQRIEAFGSKGQILTHNIAPTNTTTYTQESVMSENPLYSYVERYKTTYQDQIREFCYPNSNTDVQPARIHDAYMAVAIAQAAKMSFEENRPVQMSEILPELSSDLGRKSYGT